MSDDILVSVLIPNFNYGKYLRNCFDSILAQTYKNIEVIFRDNNSTDDSFEIAIEYYHIFKEKGIYFSLHKNKFNCGSSHNTNLCVSDCHGDFLYILASDDSIEPTFIETCVSIFEKYPKVGLVMTHRKEIDENGNILEGEPFYNKNCIIKGEDQATVFMMSGIAIPGQRMTRRGHYDRVKDFIRRWDVAGDWYDNFLFSMCGDVVYITEPLCNYRVHSGNETNQSEKNLLGIFEHYQLINSFCSVSTGFGMVKPAARYSEAVEKLGDMCLRYAVKMLKCRLIDVAQRYLLLAPIFKKNIVEDEKYKMLSSLSTLDDNELSGQLLKFESMYNLHRTVAYEPPEGYIEIEL